MLKCIFLKKINLVLQEDISNKSTSYIDVHIMEKVLLIEDDLRMVELVTIHLKDLNCLVDVSNNGLDGYKKAVPEITV